MANTQIKTAQIKDDAVTYDKAAFTPYDVGNDLLQLRLDNPTTAAAPAGAGLVLSTGTANSFALFRLQDQSGSPDLYLSGGPAVGTFFFDAPNHRFFNAAAGQIVAFNNNRTVGFPTLGSAPGSPVAGQVYSDGATLYYYNGTTWIDLAASGGGSSGPVVLDSGTVSGAGSIPFLLPATPVYQQYELRLSNIVSTSDDFNLFIRTSTDGGSTYASGGSDYGWQGNVNYTAAASFYGSGGDSQIYLNRINTGGQRISNVGSEGGWSGVVTVYNPLDSTSRTHMSWSYTIATASAGNGGGTGTGLRLNNQANNALIVVPSSGSISGKWTLVGIP